MQEKKPERTAVATEENIISMGFSVHSTRFSFLGEKKCLNQWMTQQFVRCNDDELVSMSLYSRFEEGRAQTTTTQIEKRVPNEKERDEEEEEEIINEHNTNLIKTSRFSMLFRLYGCEDMPDPL